MPKTILITGATDGIGLLLAKRLIHAGHRVLIHGRSPEKLAKVHRDLGPAGAYRADLTSSAEIDTMATAVAADHPHLDVLVNNAGVFKSGVQRTSAGLDIRFAVNAIAPMHLTDKLLRNMDATGRIINLSSAAQRPVDLPALAGAVQVDTFSAYAQSKLALTMWSWWLANRLGGNGPAVIAVNPGSLLDTKMVREGFGQTRGSADLGAAILERLAVSDLGEGASGLYYDNDRGEFAEPHPMARDLVWSEQVVNAMRELV